LTTAKQSVLNLRERLYNQMNNEQLKMNNEKKIRGGIGYWG